MAEHSETFHKAMSELSNYSDKLRPTAKGLKGLWQRTPGEIKYPLTVGAALGGAQLLPHVYQKAKEIISKHVLKQHDPQFRAILREHSDLVEDKDQAYKLFRSIKHFSPMVASDPGAAGAIIISNLSKFRDIGGLDFPTMQSINQVQQRELPHPFGQAVMTTTTQISKAKPGEYLDYLQETKGKKEKPSIEGYHKYKTKSKQWNKNDDDKDRD